MQNRYIAVVKKRNQLSLELKARSKDLKVQSQKMWKEVLRHFNLSFSVNSLLG